MCKYLQTTRERSRLIVSAEEDENFVRHTWAVAYRCYVLADNTLQTIFTFLSFSNYYLILDNVFFFSFRLVFDAKFTFYFHFDIPNIQIRFRRHTRARPHVCFCIQEFPRMRCCVPNGFWCRLRTHAHTTQQHEQWVVSGSVENRIFVISRQIGNERHRERKITKPQQ